MISLSPNGKYLAVEGANELLLLDLEEKYKNVNRIVLHQRNDFTGPGALEWNPQKTTNILASTHQRHVYFWNITGTTTKISPFSTMKLKNASAYVTDVSWDPFNIDILASSTSESVVNIWDFRIPNSNPLLIGSLNIENKSLGGFSKVSWNKSNEHIVSSASDTQHMIYIWDIRKQTIPFVNIPVENCITSLDWSPTDADLLLCAFSDSGEVRLFNFLEFEEMGSKPDTPVLQLHAPIIQATFAPFGDTIAVAIDESQVPSPPPLPCSVKLFMTRDLDKSLYTFPIDAPLLAFDFRTTRAKQFQIVSWSLDQSYQLIDIKKRTIHSACSQTNRHSALFSTISSGQESYGPWADVNEQDAIQDLIRDFEKLGDIDKVGNITVEEINLAGRWGLLLHNNKDTPQFQTKLMVTFPHYHSKDPPFFRFIPPSHVSPAAQTFILTKIRKVAQEYRQNYQTCLLKCLRELSNYLDKKIKVLSKLEKNATQELLDDKKQGFPCPRMSGASFSLSGKLVYFRSYVFSRSQGRFPRTYFDLQRSLVHHITSSSVKETSESLPSPQSDGHSYFALSAPIYQSFTTQLTSKFLPLDLSKLKVSRIPPQTKVFFKDCSHFTLLNSTLARLYTTTCSSNEKLALAAQRHDLVQLWCFLGTITHSEALPRDTHSDDIPWSHFPLGLPMLKALVTHYEREKDLQTLAVLSLFFQHHPIFEDHSFVTKLDRYRFLYADILWRMGFFVQQAKFRKTKPSDIPFISGLEMKYLCKHCNGYLTMPGFCREQECKKKAGGFFCSFCHLPVMGVTLVCVLCGHGGHPEHLRIWFKENSKCPIGCNCKCSLSRYLKLYHTM